MNSWIIFGFFIAFAIISVSQSRSVPSRRVPLLMDRYGNILIRGKRDPMKVHPHRAMMISGFYQPARRSANSQATGVYAQGNSISGGAYLGEKETPYLPAGPEPVDEAEIANAEAEAAPQLHNFPLEDQDVNYNSDEQSEQQSPISTHSLDEPAQFSTEAPQVEPEKPKTKSGSKKNRVKVEEESDEEEYEDSDEEPRPFIPLKASRRNPSLNNFFPMVFSFPKSYARSGNSGSVPGMITAIANSYSTGKGGVASSVATAYGGSPNGKKRRVEEE